VAGPLDAVAIEEVEREAENLIGERVDVSIYSKAHLQELFKRGHLFAWHLWRESTPIGGELPGLIEDIGPPSLNTDAAAEIRDLRSLFQYIVESPSEGASVYDAGILYVVVRNVGTSATWFFGEKNLDFSRYSPWALEALGGPEPPVAREDYQKLVLARKASTGGTVPPSISPPDLKRWKSATASWLPKVSALVESTNPSDSEFDTYLSQIVLDEE